MTIGGIEFSSIEIEGSYVLQDDEVIHCIILMLFFATVFEKCLAINFKVMNA